MHRLARVSAVVLALFAPVALAGSWSSDYFLTGPNARVNTLIRWNGSVVVGGFFNAIGNQTVNHIARRAIGSVWMQLGQDLPVTRVIDMCVHDDALHIMGVTPSGAGYVYRLEGNTWQQVGDTVAGWPLASYDGALYCGGYRWEGDAWVDVLHANDTIEDLYVMDGLLIAAGDFSSAGGISTGHVCAFDGAQVLDAFPGLWDNVRAVASVGGELYAARSVYGPGVAGVQVWRDDHWQDVPELGRAVDLRSTTALAMGEDRFYVVSYEQESIDHWPGETFVYSWDGQAADLILHDDTYAAEIFAVLEDAGGLYLGGQYVEDGTTPCVNLGYFANGTMTPICATGLGTFGRPFLLRSGPGGLAVGGIFTSIGDQWSTMVGVYDGNAWQSRSTDRQPASLAWQGDRLVALFEDDASVSSWIGHWDEGGWSLQQLSPASPYCKDLETWQGRTFSLSSGGIIEIVGDATVVPFATPDDGFVEDLAVVGGVLVAGGEFSGIDGTSATNIARFDGSAWQPLGGGLPTTVRQIGAWRGEPVVVRHAYVDTVISAFDGATWQDLGTIHGGGTADPSLQEYGGALYVGGSFARIDDAQTPYLARWDGETWASVGDLDGEVHALAVLDGTLWAAGYFRHVDGVPTAGIVPYLDPVAVPESAVPASRLAVSAAPNPFNPRTTLRFTVPVAAVVTVDVYDVAGKRVRRVFSGLCAAGDHELGWDGLDARGRALPSGAYLVRVKAGDDVASARVALVR